MTGTETPTTLPRVSMIRLAFAQRNTAEFHRLHVITEVEELEPLEELLGMQPLTTTRMTIGCGSVVTQTGPTTYRVERKGRPTQEHTAVGRCEITGKLVLRRAYEIA